MDENAKHFDTDAFEIDLAKKEADSTIKDAQITLSEMALIQMLKRAPTDEVVIALQAEIDAISDRMIESTELVPAIYSKALSVLHGGN